MWISSSPRPRLARFASITALAVVLALALVACSSSGGGGNSAAAVTIKDLAFKTQTVKAGATVTVKNEDTVQHTVTSDDRTSFNITIDPGTSKTFTAPSTPGSFKFHCNIHRTMHGTLTVE